MQPKVKAILIYMLQPRLIILLVALFNFMWFFSYSSFVHHLGSTKISFCAVCPWYWDWSLTNLPTLSLFATISMFIARWKGYLIACIVSGYQIIEGINWLSNSFGFLGNIQQRREVILDSDLINFWDLLDAQYLLALIIFGMALIYLIINVNKARRTSMISYS